MNLPETCDASLPVLISIVHLGARWRSGIPSSNPVTTPRSAHCGLFVLVSASVYDERTMRFQLDSNHVSYIYHDRSAFYRLCLLGPLLIAFVMAKERPIKVAPRVLFAPADGCAYTEEVCTS